MKKNILQYSGPSGELCVGLVHDSAQIETLNWQGGVYTLAQEAIARGCGLAALAEEFRSGNFLSYDDLEKSGRLLPPITHPDPAHMLVAGTGLTHLGSADTRASMHAKLAAADDAQMTDSMRMFRMGLEGGKPAAGSVGVQPEWFYKGDGSIVVPPGGEVESPEFALDLGDEVEVVGIYIIGNDGTPFRLGFSIGNEFSDHKTEKINYLYLAHSKLRPCSIGPELALGELPSNINGTSKILRDNQVLWQKNFVSGEDNMTHTIANLEYHHFKYNAFLRPGDVHIHFFGTSTLSFADAVEAQEGDVFVVESPWFGRPLRNTYRKITSHFARTGKVTAL
jgi:hypothetical protein